MHNHPLHRPVMVECLCCRVEAEFTFTSRSDQVICKGCTRHQGDTLAKAKQRDLDHVALWRSELAIAKEDHAAEVARLCSAIDQRDQELADQEIKIKDLQVVVRARIEKAPPPTVQQWWANEQVRAAAEQRDGAYRSRDRAYRALWAVDRLHHEDENRGGYCTCGKRADRCEELGALAPAVDALIKWENNQIDRLRRDLEHGLPDDHPEVLRHGGYGRWRTGYRRAG